MKMIERERGKMNTSEAEKTPNETDRGGGWRRAMKIWREKGLGNERR